MWNEDKEIKEFAEGEKKEDKKGFGEFLDKLSLKWVFLISGVGLFVMFLLLMFVRTPEVKIVQDSRVAERYSKEIQTYIQKSNEQLLKEIRRLRLELEKLKEENERLKKEISVKKKEKEKEEKPEKLLEEIIKKRKREKRKEGKYSGPIIISPPPSETEARGGYGLVAPKIEMIEKSEEKETGKKKSGSLNEKKKKKKTVFIPATTLMRGKIIHSFLAPVIVGRGGAKPAPVLIKLEGFARLPNGKTINLNGCTVLAKAQGTWAEERAKLETAKIVCVLEDGKVIEQKFTGYVVSGIDNIEGVKGKFMEVNSKQVATYFATVGLGGFFAALQNAQVERRESAFGTYTTIKDELLYSTYGAFAETFREFSRFYLERARQIVPVVFVDAGKPVFITVINGFSLGISPEEFAKNF